MQGLGGRCQPAACPCLRLRRRRLHRRPRRQPLCGARCSACRCLCRCAWRCPRRRRRPPRRRPRRQRSGAPRSCAPQPSLLSCRRRRHQCPLRLWPQPASPRCSLLLLMWRRRLALLRRASNWVSRRTHWRQIQQALASSMRRSSRMQLSSLPLLLRQQSIQAARWLRRRRLELPQQRHQAHIYWPARQVSSSRPSATSRTV